MRKPRLIPNWRKSWRMYSMQATGLIPAIQLAREILPELREHITPSIFGYIACTLAVLAIIGRLIHQDKAE